MFRLLFTILLLSSQVFAITIDDFETTQTREYVTSSHTEKSSSVASVSSLGGQRTIYTQWLSGPACNGDPSSCVQASTLVGGSELTHSQENTVKARFLVTWDGDSTAETYTNPIPTGLQGGGLGFNSINLSTDGSTAILLPLVSFDFGGLTSVRIRVRAYTSETNFSDAEVTLSQPYNILDNKVLSFRFAGADPADAIFQLSPDALGAADFTQIKALQLFVSSLGDGNGGTDLSFTSIQTNGECDLVPQHSSSGYQIYGDCGFCYDQDQQKNECELCPQHPLYEDCRDCADEICLLEGRDPQTGECRMVNQNDTCGVCNGDGSSCADCNGVPNGGAVLDECGVCGGSNSCLDCAGTPFGQAKLDNCGVCEGDNSSCTSCTTIDVSPLSFALDAEAKNQELPIQRMLRELVKYDRRPKNMTLRSKLGAQARDLQVRNWVISWTIQGTNTQCVDVGTLALCDFSDLGEGLGDEFGPKDLCIDPNSASQNVPSYCVITAVNQAQANEYRAHAEELWEITGRVAKILAKQKKKVGVFEAKKLQSARKVGLRRGTKAYQKALSLANRVPLKTVNCTAP